MKIVSAKFLTSAPTIKETPPDCVYPEVAVMGRSNVGKSSFLCSLTNRRGLAKVSSTPGKTRLINYFLIDDSWYLVDLPGYGFAKVSKEEKERWGQAMEEYLIKRRGLKLAILLVDSRHEPKDSDIQMLDWLRSQRLNVQVVLTKCDKISRGKYVAAGQAIAEAMQIPADSLIFYSSETGQGREEVLSRLSQVVGKKKA